MTTEDFNVTPEMLAHHESINAMESVIESLTPGQMIAAMEAVSRVSAAAQQRYGVTPSSGSVLASAGVRSHITTGATLDIESCLFSLESGDIRIARSLAGSPDKPEAISEADLSAMSPARRISYARQHGLS